MVGNSDEPYAIGFLIGNFLGHGRGGHYWDLKTIAESINEKADVIIFNIGVSPSPVLEGSKVKVINLPVNFRKNIKLVSEEVISNRIQSLFCIDIRVGVIAEMVSRKTKTPIIHIKPGGPNPSTSYPDLKELIVYSKENYNYFKSLRNYNEKTLHFLPNRSEKVTVDEEGVQELNALNTSSAFKFVQVLRICKEYESNVHRSLELIKRIKLTASNVNVVLFVIGVVQDKEVFQRLLAMAGDMPVHFITDSKYTESASRLLPLGDAIIGNGRSVMEASSLGLPILVSACNNEVPVLLDPVSFDEAFEVNFSPRFKLAEKELKSSESFDKIIRLINDKGYYLTITEYSLRCFKKYFDIRNVTDKYLEISRRPLFYKISLLSLLKLLRFYFTTWLRLYRKK